MEMKVACLKELPLNAGVTGSTPGADRKAETGRAGGTTFPILPWRTLVFCQSSWREAAGGGVAPAFPRDGCIWTILRLRDGCCCMTVTEFDHFRTA